jgi:uncharacterized membrane protein YeaQ/YmgE (transglycosylase-associated protein family)
MNVLAWLLFGLLVGLVTNMASSVPSRAVFIREIIIGVTGALMGGMTAVVLLDLTLARFNFLAFSIAAVSSFLFLFFGKQLQRL